LLYVHRRKERRKRNTFLFATHTSRSLLINYIAYRYHYLTAFFFCYFMQKINVFQFGILLDNHLFIYYTKNVKSPRHRSIQFKNYSRFTENPVNAPVTPHIRFGNLGP
jgi:hypothetical protein